MSATAYTALTSFREALYLRLRTLTANMEVPVKFEPRDSDAVSTSSVGDGGWRARLCELKKPAFNRYPWFGSGVNAVQFTFPLEITYPDTYDWRAIATDDALKIGDSLRETPLGSTGLHLCNVVADDAMRFEDLPGGEWFVMTINLLVIIDESS